MRLTGRHKTNPPPSRPRGSKPGPQPEGASGQEEEAQEAIARFLPGCLRGTQGARPRARRPRNTPGVGQRQRGCGAPVCQERREFLPPRPPHARKAPSHGVRRWPSVNRSRVRLPRAAVRAAERFPWDGHAGCGPWPGAPVRIPPPRGTQPPSSTKGARRRQRLPGAAARRGAARGRPGGEEAGPRPRAQGALPPGAARAAVNGRLGRQGRGPRSRGLSGTAGAGGAGVAERPAAGPERRDSGPRRRSGRRAGAQPEPPPSPLPSPARLRLTIRGAGDKPAVPGRGTRPPWPPRLGLCMILLLNLEIMN